MNNLQIFKNPQFGDVRVVWTNDEPMFCLADLCRALDLTNPSSVRSRLEDSDVQLIDFHALNSNEGTGNSIANFINESGFYDVLLQSSSNKVKPFRKWVTSEVLPSIRKNGMYATDITIDKMISDPDFAIKLLTNLKEERSKRIAAEETVKIQQPKVEFFDTVMDSKDTIDMNDVAKTLDMGIGRNNLFEFLRDNNVLMQNNKPYQRYVDAGWFRTVESSYNRPNGDTCIYIKTVVFQRGVSGIRNLLKNKGYKHRNGSGSVEKLF